MFKPGDKVLIVGFQKGITDMEEALGTICTVQKRSGNAYILKENIYSWLESWLAPVGEDIVVSEEDYLSLIS